MSYQKDREWSDRFIPMIRMIVGPLLLVPSGLEEDRVQATDLIVLKARDMRIAARVRSPGYADKYPWEFTLRSYRESGTKTELEKVIDGFGDWLFYGHATDDDRIGRWMIIELKAWRAYLIRLPDGERNRAGIQKSNGDGTGFHAFDVRRCPQIVVASSIPVPAIIKTQQPSFL